MSTVWNEAELQKHITDSIPESLNLDYKAAGALAKSNEKRAEVTKDVSAMANSDGGILIYGISEDKSVVPPVPSQITPVDAGVISKEWLEQVINTIRPRLDGVIIHPVQLSSAPNHFAYVVEIPRSTTAHQAQDKKYYKRFNFESTAMDDYEIRDVMGREQHPLIDIEFAIREVKAVPYQDREHGSDGPTYWMPSYMLVSRITNNGSVLANYINSYIYVPRGLFWVRRIDGERIPEPPGVVDIEGQKYVSLYKENNGVMEGGSLIVGLRTNTNIASYIPLLPGRTFEWTSFLLVDHMDKLEFRDKEIRWEIFADNAPKRLGAVQFHEILNR